MGNRSRRTAGSAGDSDARRGQDGRSRAATGSAARTRSDQARHGRRPASGRGARPTARSSKSGQRPRIGWGRRLGVVGALLLAGAGVVFAGQALQNGAGAPRSSPAAIGSGVPSVPATGGPSGPATGGPIVLPAAPMLDELVAATPKRAIAVTGRLRETLPAGGGPYRLRIYVNDQLRREVRLGRQEVEFRVEDVPLERGPNSIRGAIAGDFGETLHSAAVLVERDDEAPAITLVDPADGAVVFEATATLRGTTEPGAVVTVSNPAAGAGGSTLAGADGSFALAVQLAVGPNQIMLTSRDRATNADQLTLTLERRESSAGVTIVLSRDGFDVDRLPATITVSAHLTGVDGQALDGVEVTFSLSAPGQMTTTYTAVAAAGVASWVNVVLPRDGAIAGRGLVTVMADLDDGQELRGSASFTFR